MNSVAKRQKSRLRQFDQHEVYLLDVSIDMIIVILNDTRHRKNVLIINRMTNGNSNAFET